MDDETSGIGRWRGAWPHLRAVFVAFHVFAVTVLALPAPGGAMNRTAWKEPTVQAELSTWAARLRMPVADLEERLWGLATTWMDTRRAVLDPLLPYYRVTGTWQSWRMFVAPHTVPARLEVDVMVGGEWVPVYVRGDPEHAWRRRQLDHDRMRAQVFRLSWPGYGSTYDRFGTWLATEAAVDFPEATHLRTRFRRARTPSPAEVRAGVSVEGRPVQERVKSLERQR